MCKHSILTKRPHAEIRFGDFLSLIQEAEMSEMFAEESN
mgnify:CR=1 FL=1